MANPPLITSDQAQSRCPDYADDPVTFALMQQAATDAVTSILGFDPMQKTLTEIYSGLGGPRLIVNRHPITAVAGVVSTDLCGVATTYQAAQLTHDGDRMITLQSSAMVVSGLSWSGGVFPAGQRNLAVTYTAGYAVPPATIVLAALMIMQAMWDAREVEQNATGESYEGVLSQSWWPSGPGAIPPQAFGMLQRYANIMNAG